jgi:hypothetical protein
VGHKLFLPQEVVWRDVWTRDLQRRHNSKWQSPQRKMQSTTHLNKWMQYTSQAQFQMTISTEKNAVNYSFE